MKTNQRSILAAVFTAVCTGGAIAQTDGTYLLVASNDVTPATPSATIEIWATWTGAFEEHVFTGGNYDINAAEGEFSNPTNILNGPGSTAGVAAGRSVVGAGNGQIHILPSFGFGSPDNPILLATYQWSTSNFTPRTVELGTSNTSVFNLAVFISGRTIELYPIEFTAGSGIINVVPAPGVLCVIALPLLARGRRAPA